MSRAFTPLATSPASHVERAAAELRGWLDAGESLVVLLAPRGAARRATLERLLGSLGERFVAEPWSGDPSRSPTIRVNTVGELRGTGGPRALILVEDGERMDAEGARVLRALIDEAAGARCAVVAVAASEAGAVLPVLGSALEMVVLRDPHRASASRLRGVGAGAAAILAGVSVALATVVLLPRFRPEPPPPLVSVEARRSAPLPQVEAAPPEPAPSAPAEAPRAAAPPAHDLPLPPPTASAARPSPPPRPERRTPPVGTRASAKPVPAPAAGWLVVNAIPRALIIVDGNAIGPTPIVRHPLGAGRHRIGARFDDGSADERTIQTAGGEHYLMFDGR